MDHMISRMWNDDSACACLHTRVGDKFIENW